MASHVCINPPPPNLSLFNYWLKVCFLECFRTTNFPDGGRSLSVPDVRWTPTNSSWCAPIRLAVATAARELRRCELIAGVPAECRGMEVGPPSISCQLPPPTVCMLGFRRARWRPPRLRLSFPRLNELSNDY